VSEEQRLIEEEEAGELYRDVDINQGRGLQLSQDIEDSHVTLTQVNPDGQQEISSVSSHFVSSMLNPTSDVGMESIFVTVSSPIAPLQTPTPIMTPSTIATITTMSHAQIPPTPIPITADLSEIELKKILIEKMEGNKEDVRMMMIRKDPPLDQTNGLRGKEKALASESAFTEEHVQTTSQIEEPSHPVFETGAEDQPIVQTSQHPECELLDTPLDFFNFIMNRLGVDTLTPELLAGPTYELIRGSCNSLTKLEYHLEEVYKAMTDQLDWVNPEGQQYPHNLLQPLPLIPDNRGRRVIPFAHFINNDLEYLQGGASSRKYTTSVTKTKAADYGHIKWIEDLVPRTMWIQELINYCKHALWGVSHWGRKRQQFYGFAVNQESALDVYSKRRIIAVTDLKIVEWHNYKLRLQDIEDMLLLLVQGKLSNLTVEERFAFNISLRMFTRSIVIQRRRREAYTAYSNPRGFIYQNKDKKNRLMRIDKLHKFNDGTLNDVRNALDDHLKGIRMQYLPQTIWRKGDKDRAVAMIQAIDKMLETRRIMRSLERFVGGRLYEGDFRMLQRTI
nr:hypothetical protein [Tanacetum cinerariifolium]